MFNCRLTTNQMNLSECKKFLAFEYININIILNK